MAHGFELEVLGKLVSDGLASVDAHATMAGRQRVRGHVDADHRGGPGGDRGMSFS